MMLIEDDRKMTLGSADESEMIHFKKCMKNEPTSQQKTGHQKNSSHSADAS